MAKFQLNIGNPESGKTHRTIIEGAKANTLIGKRISEEIDGGQIGFPGYLFKITGGSDKDGFPMRSNLEGPIRKRILATGGQGFTIDKKGMKKRKMVRGNTISDEIYQVNVKIVQMGKKKIEELITGE
ncbi:MAG: 30S ribosomal protein S6e [Asgard group archaeon]|nr:30S ribosomal protein S6e [Asgard group archaeon]